VRGEGAGMLVLKKLSAAERDGDHIYGLIRGSAENHGGRAQSLTAPNPKAQAALLKRVYTQAGIDPRTVSYIEAHGTGTPLGDPIEVNALKSAFAELGGEGLPAGYCGLGSVKTNIGHLELAAGVAGVIKVLLQFKHKTLVKSLHSEQVNPYIQLEGSPFYIVQRNQPWERLKDEDGNELPRRAGVSSFGFGGVNAHVILEEYIAREAARVAMPVSSAKPAIVVLSAKNDERLKEQAEQLLEAVQARELSDADLADVAYTLQIGREAMEVRLGLLVDSMATLKDKLRAVLDGRDVAGVYEGHIKRGKEAQDGSVGLDAAQWVADGHYGKLLESWVKGLAFDWRKLYGETKPRRISLPTYPFAKERYWITSTKPSVEEPQEKNLVNEVDEHALYGALIDGIKEGELTVEEAIRELERMGITFDEPA
jgi:polyketide synthase PksN